MISHIVKKIKEDRQFNKYILSIDGCYLFINTYIIDIRDRILSLNIKNYQFRIRIMDVIYVEFKNNKFNELYVCCVGCNSHVLLGENRTKFILNKMI